MKTKIQISLSILLMSVALQSSAQLIWNGISQNFYGQLDNSSGLQDNWSRSIGIGYFGSGFPNSFLHINSNIGLLPANGSIANYGEVFRTDAPADVTTAWRMFSGNVSANEKFNIRNTTATNHVVFGTVQSGHLDFHTNNTFRGRVTSDGALYFSGTSGSTPASGAGTRLMWIPEAGAFRAGTVNGTQWDSGSIGVNSFAGGYDNIASGDYSAAFGNTDTVSGDYGFAAGIANVVTGNGAAALGINNKCLNEGAIALGDDNVVEGHDAVAAGELCYANGWASIAMGYNMRAMADKSVAIGNGLPLVNNTQNSMMVGFNHDEATLFVGGPQYSDDFGKVGVATSDPTARLHVERDASGEITASTFTAARVNMTGAPGEHTINEGANIRLETGEASGASENRGIIVYSEGAEKNHAAKLEAIATEETVDNFGVYVRAFGGEKTTAGYFSTDNTTASTINKGITVTSSATSTSLNTGADVLATGGAQTIGTRSYATSGSGMTIGLLASASGTVQWAGWFNGNAYATGLFIPSDEALKQNIAPANSSMNKLNTLEVMDYEYNVAAFPDMKLPAGAQTGLMAANLEIEFPELVAVAIKPMEVDSAGNSVGEPITFKAVNYTGLIPHLVNAIQDLHAENAVIAESLVAQQEAITAQQSQIEALTALVASCCASDKSNNNPGTPKAAATGGYDINIERATLDQNVPNPFTTETSITYRIPEQAAVRVRVMDSAGQQVDMLVDGLMPKGEYRIVWTASHLPAGTYYYTLEADGIELVKKAVKL